MTSPGRPLRIALIAAATVSVLGAAAAVVAAESFDPNAYKPQIVQAVRHATGRDLTLNGKISLKASLWPTIQVADVTFSNPAGFSRPQMASLQGMELRLGLWPLLFSRFEINRLVLIHPDILLETDPGGHPNWQLTPEVSPAAPAGTQAPVKSRRTTTAISVNAIRIQDGMLAYRDDRNGKVTTLDLPRLAVAAASPDSPLHLDAGAKYDGIDFSLTGDTGSLTRLQDATATTPWPIKLALTIGAATLNADGSLTQPLLGKGYDLTLNGVVPDVLALAPLLPGVTLPKLHGVKFAARIADSGSPLPAVSSLTLTAGDLDLAVAVPGLMLNNLSIAAVAGQPTRVGASGTVGGQPVAFAAVTGPLALLMPGVTPGSFPVDVSFQVAGAALSAKGTVADVWTMSGANIALTAKIPDLTTLSPLLRRSLPALRQVAFQGTLSDATGGFRNGLALHGITMTSADEDIAGDAAMGFGMRKSITADLRSNHFDLDALQASISQAPAAASSLPAAASPQPVAAPVERVVSERVFSDQPLPFSLLRAADVDLKLAAGDVRSGGADYKALNVHTVVTSGKLVIDPITAELPGGHLSAAISADATQAAPPVRVMLRAPGVALNTLLAALHQPPYASGNLELYVNLHGAGASAHAIASSVDGSVGLAVAGGGIDNRLIGSLLGKAMNTLNALDLVGRGGTSPLKCFGLRMDLAHGVGTFSALALSSSLLSMTGGGSINLGDEALALVLYPQARIVGNSVVIPLNIGGSLRNPAVKVNSLQTAGSNAGLIGGMMTGNPTALRIVGGLFGSDKNTADICTPSLAAARVAEAGVASAATSGMPPGDANASVVEPVASDPGTPNAAALLKNLFR